MYLENCYEKLTEHEEFEKLSNLTNNDTMNFNIGMRFFKCLITSFLENISGAGDYDFSISEYEINCIADKLMQNGSLWEIIDENISKELQNYEAKRYKIGDTKIEEKDLRKIYNFVYGKNVNEITNAELENFYKDIEENKINVNIFNEKDILEYNNKCFVIKW